MQLKEDDSCAGIMLLTSPFDMGCILQPCAADGNAAAMSASATCENSSCRMCARFFFFFFFFFLFVSALVW